MIWCIKRFVVSELNESCLWQQIWTLARGISRRKNAPYVPTSNGSTAAAMIRTRATPNSSRWTTACKACWDSGSTFRKTSKWTTTSGWSGRSFPNPFPGKNSCSEHLSRVSSPLHYKGWENNFYQSKTLSTTLRLLESSYRDHFLCVCLCNIMALL